MKSAQVALVGAGFMGRMHAQVYGVLPHAELATVYDYKPGKGAELGRPEAESFEAVLADPGIDVVDICLPTHLHADFSIRALEAGKHVVCEKPMALTVADAQMMADAARQAGKNLMVAHCIRFWPEYAYLKQLKEESRLGRLVALNLTRFGAFPAWSSDGWIGKEELSGGGALDMHIHDTDFALYLCGEPDSVDSWVSMDEHGPSYIHTNMMFGQAIAHLEGGWRLPGSAPFRMAFRAIFERGFVMMDACPLTVYEEGREPFQPELPKLAGSAAGGNISDLGGYYNELEHFYACLAEGRAPEVATPDSSVESLRICLSEIAIGKAKLHP